MRGACLQSARSRVNNQTPSGVCEFFWSHLHPPLKMPDCRPHPLESLPDSCVLHARQNIRQLCRNKTSPRNQRPERVHQPFEGLNTGFAPRSFRQISFFRQIVIGVSLFHGPSKHSMNITEKVTTRRHNALVLRHFQAFRRNAAVGRAPLFSHCVRIRPPKNLLFRRAFITAVVSASSGVSFTPSRGPGESFPRRGTGAEPLPRCGAEPHSPVSNPTIP